MAHTSKIGNVKNLDLFHMLGNDVFEKIFIRDIMSFLFSH